MILRTCKGYFSKSSLGDSRAGIMDRFMNASFTQDKVEPVVSTVKPEVDEVLLEHPGNPQLADTSDNCPYADRTVFMEKNISPSSSTILGKYYEHLVIKALQSRAYCLSVNGQKKDGKDKGIDFYGRFTEIAPKYPFIGQCKFYRSKSLPVTVIRELIGTLDGLKSGSEKPPFDFRLKEELIGMVVASVPLSKDSLKLLLSTRHPMIFFRFVPNSTMASDLFSSHGDGHMQSLILNETAGSLLDPFLKIETRYDEKLSVALKRSVRHEIFKYHNVD